jgi:hypothetical protein
MQKCHPLAIKKYRCITSDVSTSGVVYGLTLLAVSTSIVTLPHRRAQTARALVLVITKDASHKGSVEWALHHLFLADLQASAMSCRGPLNDL